MTPQEWEAANNEYLAAAVQWLHARIDFVAGGGHPEFEGALVADTSVPPPAPVPELAPTELIPARRRKRHFWSRRTRTDTPPSTSPSPPPSAAPSAAESPTERAAPVRARGHAEHRASHALRRAESELEQAAAMDPPPALHLLADSLGLSTFERDTLLMCVAVEFDRSLPARFASVHGDPGAAYPTFALAMVLLPGAAWEALSPRGGLRFWMLIDVVQHAGQPLTAAALRADERTVNFVKGLNHLDARLESLVAAVDAPGEGDELPPSHVAAVDRVLARVTGPTLEPGVPVVQLVGSDSPTKLLVANHVVNRLGRTLYRLRASSLPTHPADLELLARLWHRESMLRSVGLFLDADDTDDGADHTAEDLAARRFVVGADGILLLAARDAWGSIDRPSAVVEVDRPTRLEQRDAWARALTATDPALPDRLAGQFRLALPAIRSIAHSVRADAVEATPDAMHDRVWSECLAITRPKVSALTRRVEPKATWDDLVLPKKETALLRRLVAQVRKRSTVYSEWGFEARMNRGLGVSALFSGASGTGKTMAAEVVASDLQLNLYVIDLAAVVSKYIGETEKNLRRVFDAAENGGALLFFDEADALFGKRSEVRDSHDRYANIEINYLLQRMEAFDGVAILATNQRAALDSAFLRRLRFIVNFPLPGVDERRRLWQGAFPAATPHEELDLELLARLPASGAMIHNIALGAAFLAASGAVALDTSLVLDAAQTEFLKLDLPVPAGMLPAEAAR